MRVEHEDESLTLSEDRPEVVIYQGARLVHLREYRAGKDGRREESLSEIRMPFSRRCEVTSDDRVHCQISKCSTAVRGGH